MTVSFTHRERPYNETNACEQIYDQRELTDIRVRHAVASEDLNEASNELQDVVIKSFRLHGST